MTDTLQSPKIPKILLFVGFYLPGFRAGGPIRTIANLVSRLRMDFEFLIFTSDRDLGDEVPYQSIDSGQCNKVDGTAVTYVSPKLLQVCWRFLNLRPWRFDVIYLNSFFSFLFSIAPLALSRVFARSVPVVIAPRGEFSNAALLIKHKKKRIFLAFCALIRLHKNIVWHASSEYEASDIRRVMGPDVDVRVAVDLSVVSDEIFIKTRKKSESLRVVTLSRISPIKNLLASIQILKLAHRSVKFDVYGPVEDSVYWDKCLKAAQDLPAYVEFSYCGELRPAAVPQVLSNYDLLLLPTLGENFGHVIAESLCAGVPVLISDQTPWRELAAKGVGWDISLKELKKFSEKIDECCDMTSSDYLNWRNEISRWAIKNIGSDDQVNANRKLFLNLGD